jgi:type I restriction enzyme R subunit
MNPFAFPQREMAGGVRGHREGRGGGACRRARTACFYAWRARERAVSRAHKHDAAPKPRYPNDLSALFHEPSVRQAAGEAVFSTARVIDAPGNRAVHGHRPVPAADAPAAVRELCHFLYWSARRYGRIGRPAPGLAFEPTALLPLPRRTARGGAPSARGCMPA